MPVRTIPLVLARATLTLYGADAAGNPLLTAPVWMGARAEGLRLEQEIAETDSTPTGADYPEYEQLGETNQISIQRIWVIPLNTQRDYQLGRDEFVLVVYWDDVLSGLWHRRTYYGVKGRNYDLASQGWDRQIFLSDQLFRARYFITEQGTLSGGGELIPSTPEAGCEAPLLFNWFDDAAITNGDYLVEVYQFQVPVTLGFARVISQEAGAGPVVLELEVGGSLTGATLTIPSGLGTEQEDSDTFAVAVPADTVIKWKCVSGSGARMIGLTLSAVET